MWDAQPFVYQEVDVMKPEGKIWRDLYEFDTPVVRVTYPDTWAGKANLVRFTLPKPKRGMRTSSLQGRR